MIAAGKVEPTYGIVVGADVADLVVTQTTKTLGGIAPSNLTSTLSHPSNIKFVNIRHSGFSLPTAIALSALSLMNRSNH